MTSENVAQIIFVAAMTGFYAWMTPAALRILVPWLHQGVTDALRVIRNELHPFALPLVCVAYLASAFTAGGADKGWGRRLADFAIYAAGWWIYRTDPDDDDRWHRRRKWLVDRVRSIGHRLVTAPAPGTA